MTQILLSPLIQEAAGGTPTRARLTARPTYDTLVEREKVTFAQLLSWDFDGVTLPVITLPEPHPNTAWVLELTSGARTVTRTVTFSGPTVRWDQLIDVDPGTLHPLPIGTQLAAWVAVRDAILAAPKIPGPPGPPGVTSVVASRVAPDAPLTYSLSNGVLSLGIPQGFPGDKGDKGDKGDRGDAGQIGPAGLTFRGSWSNVIDYVQNDAVYHDGASWFAMQDPTLGAVPGANNAWVPLAIMGQKGDPGDDGTDGTNGTSVTSAQATTLGPGATATAALVGEVLQLGIPTGLKGDKGDKGDKGNTGDAGAPGTSIGLTDYWWGQISLYNGAAKQSNRGNLYKFGPLVVFDLDFTLNNGGVWDQGTMTLPEPVRPAKEIFGQVAVYYNGWQGFASYSIGTDGVFKMKFATGSNGNGMEIHGSRSWITNN